VCFADVMGLTVVGSNMGSFEVGSDGAPNDGRLGFDPTDAPAEAMGLEPQERAQGQPDVVPLGFGLSALAPLDPGALLNPQW
jgi:hypothetical protein